MAGDLPEPLEDFETWLLRRVVQAIEAGEVPLDLLIELRAEIEAVREEPEGEGQAEAVRDVTETLGIPLEEVESTLATLEAQPSVICEVVLRR